MFILKMFSSVCIPQEKDYKIDDLFDEVDLSSDESEQEQVL